MDIQLPTMLKGFGRRARRVERTSERILATALGFGLAYYFDTENGSARRQKLRRQLRRVTDRIDAVLAADPVPADIPPVFYPLLRSQPQFHTQREAKTG
jgi:hypothetical protein